MTQPLLLSLYLMLHVAIPWGNELSASTDVGKYVTEAQGLLAGGDLGTFSAPLYPLFLSGCMALTDHWIQLVVWLQVGMLALTGHLTYRIALRYGQRVAIVAMAIVIFNPNSFLTARLVQTETVFTLLLVGGVWGLHRE